MVSLVKKVRLTKKTCKRINFENVQHRLFLIALDELMLYCEGNLEELVKF